MPFASFFQMKITRSAVFFRRLCTSLRREMRTILHNYHLQPATRTTAAYNIVVLGISEGYALGTSRVYGFVVARVLCRRAKSRTAHHEPAQRTAFQRRRDATRVRCDVALVRLLACQK
jgi:hypothetical protein